MRIILGDIFNTHKILYIMYIGNTVFLFSVYYICELRFCI